jgi:predicted Fe-Mo cluster-binding NifX family protein
MIKKLWFAACLAVLAALPAVAEQAVTYRPDVFAIAAEGSQVSAPISDLSGVSPYFHIYDIEGAPVEVLANPHLDLEFGTGPAVAATLADKGVTVLVGGMAGPKMMDVLDARQVRFVRRVGSVEDVVRELKN